MRCSRLFIAFGIIAVFLPVISGCAARVGGSSQAAFHVTHAVYSDFALPQARMLSPEEAKAILIVKSAAMDLSSGGSGGPSGVGFGGFGGVYEVFGERNAWYVFCHGGWLGPQGRTVFVDRSWNIVSEEPGPPPAGSLR
jgi:hypothetical protein